MKTAMKASSISIIKSLFAAFLFGIGLGMCIMTPFGSDPMSVFVSGLAATSGIAYSLCNFFLNTVEVIIVVFLDYKQIGFVTIFSPFLVSLGIQVYISFFSISNNLWIQLVMYLIGIVLSAYAISIIIKKGYGKTPYDALIYSIMERLNTKYSYIRWCVDISFVCGGVLLCGTCGIGTIVNLLCMGKLIELFLKLN